MVSRRRNFDAIHARAGQGGTLAPVVARCAGSSGGAEILRWDRRVVALEDRRAALGFLDREQPDAIAHLAVGSVA
jgi:hypothetical protein